MDILSMIRFSSHRTPWSILRAPFTKVTSKLTSLANDLTSPGAAQLLRVTLKHEDHPYIYLDPIEAATTGPVECRPDAKAGNKTDLTLQFRTDEFFERAQRHWKPTLEYPLHFVVEGTHCFQAAGDRSIYMSVQGFDFRLASLTTLQFDRHQVLRGRQEGHDRG